MFFSNIVAASILAFTASALPAPLIARAPETSTSKGIRLVVNVTEGDFADTPVQGLEINVAHTGAGINRAVATAGAGSIFYSNGTDAQAESWTANLINDTPSFPQGFVIMFEGAGGASGAQFEAEISAAQDATREPADGMQVSKTGPAFIDRLGASPGNAGPGTFIVCRGVAIPEIPSQTFNALYWLATSQMPADCVAVHLVPQCDTLADLPEGAAWNHNSARESRCYADVSAITSWA